MKNRTWRHEKQHKSLFGVVLGAPGRDLGAQWAPWPSQMHFRVEILRSWTPSPFQFESKVRCFRRLFFAGCSRRPPEPEFTAFGII
jgi:hypothetical protein